MADAPFFAVGVSEQADCGKKKQTPSPLPKTRVLPVDLSQHLEDFGSIPIVVGEPVAGCLLIMPAVPLPLGVYAEDILKLPDQPMTGHDAAGEEMLRDPV